MCISGSVSSVYHTILYHNCNVWVNKLMMVMTMMIWTFTIHHKLKGSVHKQHKCKMCSLGKTRLKFARFIRQGSRIRSVRILFFERYARTLTYSILAYAYPRALLYVTFFANIGPTGMD